MHDLAMEGLRPVLKRLCPTQDCRRLLHTKWLLVDWMGLGVSHSANRLMRWATGRYPLAILGHMSSNTL